MAETSNRRRRSSFEACKQIHLKLLNSIINVLIFLVRLLIVIISAVALYVAHYCYTDTQKTNLIEEAKMQINSQNEALNSSDGLLRNRVTDDEALKRVNTPRL